MRRPRRRIPRLLQGWEAGASFLILCDVWGGKQEQTFYIKEMCGVGVLPAVPANQGWEAGA